MGQVRGQVRGTGGGTVEDGADCCYKRGDTVCVLVCD